MDSKKNELVSADLEGPSKGAQAARGLAPAEGAASSALSTASFGRKGRRRAPAADAADAPCRILITQEASKSLDDLVTKVANGFDGGHIGRPQIASWILQQFALRIAEADIEKIRSTYFDRVAYLEALLKRAKESGVPPPELDALFDGKGAGSSQRKRAV